MNTSIAARRLRNQWLVGQAGPTPAAVVGWMGAVQAQEYPAARWGLAVRMTEGARDETIQRAFDAGRILRTHVMRPTWHFVTPADIRWMLELTGPRVQRSMQPYDRRLELDARTLTRATAVLERALGDRQYLTRTELALRLRRAGIVAQGQRLARIALHAELEGVICSGPRRGSQFTYALLSERAPRARRLDADEALGELSRRYFRSHGPATIRDFVWWSGLTTADARRAVEIARARPESLDGLTYWTVSSEDDGPESRTPLHLLPVYDEYLVAYRDRVAVPHEVAGIRAAPGRQAAFHHPLVVRGQVAGTWRPVRTAEDITLQVLLARPPGRAARRALEEAASRYSACLGLPAVLSVR